MTSFVIRVIRNDKTATSDVKTNTEHYTQGIIHLIKYQIVSIGGQYLYLADTGPTESNN